MELGIILSIVVIVSITLINTVAMIAFALYMNNKINSAVRRIETLQHQTIARDISWAVQTLDTIKSEVDTLRESQD